MTALMKSELSEMITTTTIEPMSNDSVLQSFHLKCLKSRELKNDTDVAGKIEAHEKLSPHKKLSSWKEPWKDKWNKGQRTQ